MIVQKEKRNVFVIITVIMSLVLSFSLNFASLEPYLDNPTNDITVVKGRLFNISTGVVCKSSECFNIIAKLDPIKVENVSIPIEIEAEISRVGHADVIVIFEEKSSQRMSAFNIKKTKNELLKEKKDNVKFNQDKFLENLNSKKSQFVFNFFSINKDNFQVKNQYSTVNAIAGRINEKGLEILKNQTNIKAITPIRKVSINLQESVSMINSDSVWYLGPNNTGYQGDGQTVCVIDTGIRTTHQGFTGRIVAQKCYCSVDGGCCLGGLSVSNNAEDDQGHGTHCAGIVMGDYGSYKGVAPKAGVVGVKALNSVGSGLSSDIISAIDWCTANALNYNISVISLSLGGGTRYSTDCDANNPGFAQAISDAVAMDIFVAVASGNDADSTGISAPACVSNAFSVGAVYDNTYSSITFSSCSDSNTFPDMITCFSNRAENLDMMAPGGGISSMSYSSDTAITQMFGTSQAAPHIAGAAILLKEFYKKKYDYNIKPNEIAEKLKSSAKPLFDSNSNNYYPRVNLDYTLEKGVIPEFGDWNGVDPFYTISSNPAQDSCLNSLSFNQNCTSLWTVNSTQTGTFEFFTIYEMGVNQVFTQRFNVTVIEGFSQVTAINFENSSYINPASLNFKFNISSSFDVQFCDLIIDNEQIERKFNPLKSVIESISTSKIKGGTLDWKISCYDSRNDLFVSETKQVNITLLTDFDGDTTDLTKVDLSNITNLVVEKISYGKIDFQDSISINRSIDFNSIIKIEKNRIVVDSLRAPELNKSARLTLKEVNFLNPIVLRNDNYCDDCIIIENDNNQIIFSVNKFSSYTISENARLEIFDETEQARFGVGENITFFANFTNITDNQPIESAICMISFEGDSNHYQMLYLASSSLYYYNKSFESEGIFMFEVECNATSQGYSLLKVSDFFPIGEGVVTAKGGYYTHSNFSLGMQSLEWSLFYGSVNYSIGMLDQNANIAYEWSQGLEPTMILATRHELLFEDIVCANLNDMNQETIKLGLDGKVVNITSTFGLANHPLFNITSVIPANTCNTTHLNVNSFEQDNVFKQMALYDIISGEMVYAGFIYDSIIGFDGSHYDYQIILPINVSEGKSDYNIYVII